MAEDIAPINPDDFKGKVKMHHANNPKNFRYFTPQAAQFVGPLWVLAEDQTLPEGLKKKSSPVVQPVVKGSNEDVLAEARQKYEEIAGDEKDANYMTWTAPRLFIEAAGLKKKKAAQVKPDVETKVEEPASETKPTVSEEKPKRKYTKKAENYAKA